jgi:tetratricopeptide (TPR) repeat protein/predicted transcriptional regulator/energy-coupling factor transporter ATP-binding protein EcfA2
MTHTAPDLVELLQRRWQLLARLVEAPTDVPTLTEELAVSRSTVRRALATFEEWTLITPDEERYEATLFARLVLTVYDDFAAEVTTAQTSDEPPRWRTAAEQATALKLLADWPDLLECAHTPCDKRTLVAELPAARSTIDRAVRELEQVALIERTAAGYRTTAIGERATVQYHTLLDTLTDLLAARDLLVHLPPECGLPPALFGDAVVERAESALPYYLPEEIQTRIDAADHVRLVLPALATPQLLDSCQRAVVQAGLTLEVLTSPGLFETLIAEFPGPLAAMATARNTSYAISVIDDGDTNRLSFGLLLAETDATTTVSVIAYSDQRTVQGTIHTETVETIQWAEDYYANVRQHANDVTADVRDRVPHDPAPVSVEPARVSDPDRVKREAVGFVQLTPAYFADRSPAPPATAWRAGFDLVDVHAGYAIDRQTQSDSDGMKQSLTDDLLTRLSDGIAHALIGTPGSGKSTVLKTVACQWYEQGRGAVFYRESGTGATFESPAFLSAQLRAAEGQTLVVVEDAVRAEASAIFRVMQQFRDQPTVTFLLDARTKEWADPPAFPPDARLDAYRAETVETVTMPALDERDCEQLVKHFQDTTEQEINVSPSHLLQGSATNDGDDEPAGREEASQAAILLLVLHRLTLTADPLAVEEVRTPTTLTEDVHRTYETLRGESDLALDVGVLVNLLNVTGLGGQPTLVYALAESDEEVETIRATLESLEGQLLFRREPRDDDPSYRTIHEAWSELFLDTLLDTAGGPAASQRFGRCVSALLALADDAAQRERSMVAVGGVASGIEQIAAAPTEWADTTIDRLFRLGLDRPGLAHLFGTMDIPHIELPAACSPSMKPRCMERRGRMYYYNGNHEQAERDFDRTVQLVETADASETAHHRAKARSQKNLGLVAFRRGNLDTAVEFFTRARASYRDISDRTGEMHCYNNLGIVAGDRGDLDRAAAYFERCLTIHQALNTADHHRVATLNNLGRVASLRGDFNRAETHLKRSISLSRNLNKSKDMSFALNQLGAITQKRGDFNQAEDYRKRAITIAHDAGHRIGKGDGLCGLAEIDIERGNLDQTAEHLQHGLEIYREIGEKQHRAQGHCYLGRIAHKRGDRDTAETHLADALSLCREGASGPEEAKTLVILGDLARDQNRLEQARDRFSAAVEIYRDMGAVRDVIETLERLGTICETLDDREVALAHYEAATALVEETDFIETRESLTERRAQLASESES